MGGENGWGERLGRRAAEIGWGTQKERAGGETWRRERERTGEQNGRGERKGRTVGEKGRGEREERRGRENATRT